MKLPKSDHAISFLNNPCDIPSKPLILTASCLHKIPASYYCRTNNFDHIEAVIGELLFGGTMRSLRPIWTTAILINMFLFILTAADAQPEVKSAVNAEPCTLPDIQIEERPGPTDRPTQVAVGLRLLDVTAISVETRAASIYQL
jgi:hypothetical protein